MRAAILLLSLLLGLTAPALAADDIATAQGVISSQAEAFARDAERMARFEREAKVLASLNHPNVASIYGFEESDGVRALVMELIEGPTLAERIRQGPLPP